MKPLLIASYDGRLISLPSSWQLMGPGLDVFSQMAFVNQAPDLWFVSVSPPAGGAGTAYPQTYPGFIFSEPLSAGATQSLSRPSPWE